jgi:hypothetical protein
MKSLKMLGLSSSFILLLAGCGSSDSNWGIDNSSELVVTHGPLDSETGLYRCELEDALLVKPFSIIEPQSDDTQLRVWHFKNSDEYACVLKGEAIVKVGTNGEEG